MGFCTELFAPIVFNRKTYRSKYQVLDDIEECKDLIKMCENRLRDLAMMTEPDKMFNSDSETTVYDKLSTEVDDALRELQDYYFDLFKLTILLDNWGNCHKDDGKPILPPDTIEWDTAYINGDFIED